MRCEEGVLAAVICGALGLRETFRLWCVALGFSKELFGIALLLLGVGGLVGEVGRKSMLC